jgi:hypothetical protein
MLQKCKLHEDVWESAGELNLIIRWKTEVSALFYASSDVPHGKRPQCPLNRRLGGSQMGLDAVKNRESSPNASIAQPVF